MGVGVMYVTILKKKVIGACYPGRQKRKFGKERVPPITFIYISKRVPKTYFHTNSKKNRD